jgi:hypothetical protein
VLETNRLEFNLSEPKLYVIFRGVLKRQNVVHIHTVGSILLECYCVAFMELVQQFLFCIYVLLSDTDNFLTVLFQLQQLYMIVKGGQVRI